MALTAEENRKMSLQAQARARRKRALEGLFGDVNTLRPQGSFSAQSPPVSVSQTPMLTVQSNPVRSAGNFIADPRTLPGRDIVDANNAASLALANEFPTLGSNLTGVLNKLAFIETDKDLANMRSADETGLDPININFGGELSESGSAVVQDLYRQNAIDAEVAASTEPAPAPVVEPTPFDYGPGRTPARAEELYGPGGMYGTTPLPGGLYDQMGISSGMMPSTTMAAPRPATDNVVFPSDERLKSTSQQVQEEVADISRKTAVLRGLINMVGGDSRVADRYEKQALADLEMYAGQYALSQFTDEDFASKQSLIKAATEYGLPSDQLFKLLNANVVPDQKGVTTLYDKEGNMWSGRIDSPDFNKKIESGEWFTAKPSSTTLDDPTKGLKTLHRADGTQTTISMAVDPEGNRIWLDDNQNPVEVTPYDDIVNFGSVVSGGKGKDQTLLEKLFSVRQKLKQMPESDERARLKSNLSELETLYIKNTALGGTSAANKFIDGRTAYYNGSAMIDRIFNVLGNAATKTGPMQTLYEVKGSFLDQMRQLPFWIDNDPIIKDVTERLGVTVESHVTTLAYALAKAADPNGRVSDADFESMLQTVAPGGMMDRNTLAQGLVEADTKLRMYMESVYRSNRDLAQLFSRDEIFDRSPVQIVRLVNGKDAVGFWVTDPKTGEERFDPYFEWTRENP